jgi:hypothetical protein
MAHGGQGSLFMCCMVSNDVETWIWGQTWLPTCHHIGNILPIMVHARVSLVDLDSCCGLIGPPNLQASKLMSWGGPTCACQCSCLVEGSWWVQTYIHFVIPKWVHVKVPFTPSSHLCLLSHCQHDTCDYKACSCKGSNGSPTCFYHMFLRYLHVKVSLPPYRQACG